MPVRISKTTEDAIAHFREMFLKEFNNQFIYDKCHYYSWCDNHILLVEELPVGYGSVWGLNDRNERDTIFEFFLLPEYRHLDQAFFKQLTEIPGVTKIECQSNDVFLTNLLYHFASNINAEVVLFRDDKETNITIDNSIFRKRTDTDTAMKPDDGTEVIEQDGTIVAHGGLMLNYNFPYADIYMHVFEQYRGKGFGALMVQELKKLAYQTGRVPAARCNINNHISKATLQKAGLTPCGFILIGTKK